MAPGAACGSLRTLRPSARRLTGAPHASYQPARPPAARRHILVAPIPSATAAGTTVLEATYTSVLNGWAKVGRYRDTDANFPLEAYPPDGRGNQEGKRLTFFNNVQQPKSDKFLALPALMWARIGIERSEGPVTQGVPRHGVRL